MGAFKVLADTFEQHTSTKPDSVLPVCPLNCKYRLPSDPLPLAFHS